MARETRARASLQPALSLRPALGVRLCLTSPQLLCFPLPAVLCLPCRLLRLGWTTWAAWP